MSELDVSQQELGLRAFGKPSNSAVQDIRRGSSPSIDRLKRMADALDLELYFGPRREPLKATQIVVEGKDYAHLPVLDAALSAGPGLANGDDVVLDHLAFRQDWLRRLRLSPAQASLVRVQGDSMKPTLQPGDMVLLDTSDAARSLPVRSRPPARGRAPIYGIRMDGEARIKRLMRPDADTLILLSDNPDWAPEVWTGARLSKMEPAILGRVVWWGHTEPE